MSGSAFNLIDLVKGSLTADFTNKLSSLMGESPEKTETGLSAAIPSLLSGFDSAASTSDGARRFSSAVDEADDSLLSNAESLFSKSSFLDSGLGTLRSLLGGGGLSTLTSNLGRSTGFSGTAISSLLGVLAPMVLGVLKRTMSSTGMKSTEIGNLLASQRNNIAAAMPRTMETGPREVTEESYAAPRAAYARTEGTRKGVPSWILPLVLVAGAIGLIWQLASRPTVHAGREEPTTTAQTSGRLDALRAKYEPVFKEAQTQGVRITSIHEENGKLVIKGIAPSREALNSVWNEIKRVNSRMDDISADMEVR